MHTECDSVKTPLYTTCYDEDGDDNDDNNDSYEDDDKEQVVNKLILVGARHLDNLLLRNPFTKSA